MFNSGIVGSHALCGLMLILCSILYIMCSVWCFHVECILIFGMLYLSVRRMVFAVCMLVGG